MQVTACVFFFCGSGRDHPVEQKNTFNDAPPGVMLDAPEPQVLRHHI